MLNQPGPYISLHNKQGPYVLLYVVTFRAVNYTTNILHRYQWRRHHGARGHVPPLLRMAGHGGEHCEQKNSNDQTVLTKALNQTIVLLQPKSGGARPKKFFSRRFAPDQCPPPTFAPDRCLPLSNSFRSHWLLGLYVWSR